MTVEDISGTITFGTLGYCIEVGSTVSCTKPAIGYQLGAPIHAAHARPFQFTVIIDINSLVGNKLPIEIPTVLIKWLTYGLFLHAIALCLAAVSAIFGLLAHVREFAMSCFSSCISGFAAAIALIAFLFDVVLFFVARARINSVKGGSASIGVAIWLTLVAWILLFFSGCFYTLGRCCIRRRPKTNASSPTSNDDGMRLEAIKAEAERKANQKPSEGKLPSFPEYRPLDSTSTTYYDDGDTISAIEPPRNNGYVPAPEGTRTMDGYNLADVDPSHDRGSNYSNATYPPNNLTAASPAGNQYLSPGNLNPSGHNRNETECEPFYSRQIFLSKSLS